MRRGPAVVYGRGMADETLELVRRLADGDASAANALLERHMPGLRAWVRLNSGGVIQAQETPSDLCQSVCLEILANLDRFQYAGEGAFRVWLYTTASRKIKNRYKYWLAQKRDVHRQTPLEPATPSDDDADLLHSYASICTPSQDALAREEVGRIERAFATLSEDHRQVILLARIANLPHAEVAEQMGRSEGAVRALLFRAIALLSVALE